MLVLEHINFLKRESCINLLASIFLFCLSAGFSAIDIYSALISLIAGLIPFTHVLYTIYYTLSFLEKIYRKYYE